jgi:hypothetical protein
MPLFYKGVAYGTHWYDKYDSRHGFWAPKPEKLDEDLEIINHISNGGSAQSPFLSVTTSYGVALSYAKNKQLVNGTILELEGLIYVIDSDQEPGLRIIDPVKRIAEGLKAPHDYHHSGSRNCLLELIEPGVTGLKEEVLFPKPPGNQGVETHFSAELKTMVYALRDSEILIFGEIPASCIIGFYTV